MPCPASSTLALAHAFAGRQASRQAVAIADWHMQTGTCRLAHADWHKQTSKTVVSTWGWDLNDGAPTGERKKRPNLTKDQGSVGNVFWLVEVSREPFSWVLYTRADFFRGAVLASSIKFTGE